MQGQVREFHIAVAQDYGSTPAFRQPDLRANLIEEEANETVAAIRRGDLTEAVDGLCDLLYVVFGTAIAFGIDAQYFFDEVHRTNMEKLKGEVRGDGKRLKPLGWTPPRIREMLKELGANV